MSQLRAFPHDFPTLWKLVVVALLLVVASALVKVINRVLRRAYWRRLSKLQPERADELLRSKRQQTMLTLLESLNRYVVYGAALVIAALVASEGAASAVFGAGLVVVVIGFGLQRLMIDVVSGVLLLFEGQFAVGDFIRVHTPDVSGIVEQFGLRSTTLRTLGGDRIVILNGAVTSFTRYANGYRDFRVELVGRGEADVRGAIERVIEQVAAAERGRFLVAPQLERFESIGTGDLVTATIRAVVPPSFEWLCERYLAGQLELALGDHLVGNIDVFNLDMPAFEAYRRAVLVGN